MAVFALVELQLHGLSQFEIGEIAQNVLGFDDPPEVGKRLGEPIQRVAVGQSLNDHMRWRGALLEREGHANHFFPLLLDNAQVRSLGEQGGELAIVDKAVDAIQLLILEIPDTRHKIETQQVTQGKDDFGVAVGYLWCVRES